MAAGERTRRGNLRQWLLHLTRPMLKRQVAAGDGIENGEPGCVGKHGVIGQGRFSAT